MPKFLPAVFRGKPAFTIGATLLVLQLVAIAFAPLLTGHSPVEADPLKSLQPPSIKHWFGTDVSGMDIYARVGHSDDAGDQLQHPSTGSAPTFPAWTSMRA